MITMQAVIDLEARRPVLPSFPSYGICILESRHVGGFTMETSRYDFSEVMLVLDGRGWVVHGSVRHPLKRHDLMIIPAGSSYHVEDKPGSPLAILCLCIRPETGRQNMWEPVLPRRFSVLRNLPLTREIAIHLRSILFEQSQSRDGTEAVVIAHSLLLLSKLKRKSSATEDLHDPRPREIEAFARVQDYVSQLARGFHESETIESVAHRLGLSPRTFTSYFRTLTGRSRQQYIQSLRIDHACHLLGDSSQSVTSISFACGFEDISTFFRAFRQAKKMSPAVWRSRHQ